MASISSLLTALSGFIPDFIKGDKVQQEKLRQQIVGGIFPNLVDETLLMALMNAMRKIDGDVGKKQYHALNQFYVRLTARQKNRFRNVLGTLELTEKFDPDHVTESKEEFKDGKKVGEIKKLARVQIDYEFTADDPRVQFLKNLAEDLLDPQYPDDPSRVGDSTVEEREKAVKAELLALELILKRSHKNILWRHLRVFGKRKLPRHIKWLKNRSVRFGKGADTASLRFVLGERYGIIRATMAASGSTPQEIRNELLRQARSMLPATPALAKARVLEARRRANPSWVPFIKAFGVVLVLYLIFEPIIVSVFKF